MDEEPTNNSNGIVDPDATPPVPDDAAPAAGETAPSATTGPAPLTGEKALDIVFGVALIAGEALDRAAQRMAERTKELQEQAPAFWETAEERGRPVREKLVSTLRGSTTPAPEGAAENSSSLADSLRNLGRDIGITVGGGNARQSAEEEIRTLEDRVRELEQIVVSGKTGIGPDLPEVTETPETMEAVKTEAPLSENEAESTVPSTPEISSETTAESASYAFGEDQYEDTLAASPYAVSETDDERAIEASAPATDVEPTSESEDVSPSASKRASRKKQRDFDPEATDESAPPASPEA